MTKEHDSQDEKKQQLSQAKVARLTPYPQGHGPLGPDGPVGSTRFNRVTDPNLAIHEEYTQGQRGRFSVQDPERGPSGK